MVFTCPTCYREYKTQSAYDTHCFICKSQHSGQLTTMEDFSELPTQAFMMKMMMEMSSKITSLEAKLFTVLTSQHKIAETHHAYSKKETLSILNRQEKDDVEEVSECECQNYDEWFEQLNIKTDDVNTVLDKKMLKGLSSIIKSLLTRSDSPIKKIGDRLYYYNENKWHEFNQNELNKFISDIRQMILKKFNNIYHKRHPIDGTKYIKKTTMSHSQEMKYLEQVKIMTDNSVNPDQVASIVLQN